MTTLERLLGEADICFAVKRAAATSDPHEFIIACVSPQDRPIILDLIRVACKKDEE